MIYTLERSNVLRKLFVDNYKALVNFELKLDGHALLMGANGSGKSSVLEVLGLLRRIVVGGESVADCLPRSTFTRWSNQDHQRFELDLDFEGEAFHYQLIRQATSTNERLLSGSDELFSGYGSDG